MNVERKVFVTFLVVLGLVVAGSAPAVRTLGSEIGAFAMHLVNPNEPMPELVGDQVPIGVYDNPCGDGFRAIITIGELKDGTKGLAFYLNDDRFKTPWAIRTETTLYLDYNRDGNVDETIEGNVEGPCGYQAKVEKKAAPAPVQNG